MNNAVAIVQVLDKADASANTLDDAVLGELDQILDLMQAGRPVALVIRSAKPSGFIAGADVGQFRGANDVGEIEQRMARAHARERAAEGAPDGFDDGGRSRLVDGDPERALTETQIDRP